MDIILTVELAIFLLLMGLSGFFSSSETSLFSLNELQLEQMRREGNARTPLIEKLLSQPRQLIVTILIGNEFVNIAASVISASIVIQLFGSESKWLNLVIMVPILLLVGEITPKTLAIRNNIAFATVQCHFIDLFARSISPVRWLVRKVSDILITLVVGKERSSANILTEDMVRSLAQEAVGDGALDRREALYINRIFDLGDKVVRDIMTPRSQLAHLPTTASLLAAARHYSRTGRTKVPIYEGKRDRIVGVLYARDLLGIDTSQLKSKTGSSTVGALMRPAYFVPETKTAADLFYTFRKRRLSLALTVDEYGGITGLVTMEDVLECIFGEITSTSELMQQRQMNLERIGKHRYRVDGSMTIHQFNQLLGADIVSESAETIAGLLLDAFGEIPEEGSLIVLSSFEFLVESISNQRIAQVVVKLSAKQDAGMATSSVTEIVDGADVGPSHPDTGAGE